MIIVIRCHLHPDRPDADCRECHTALEVGSRSTGTMLSIPADAPPLCDGG